MSTLTKAYARLEQAKEDHLTFFHGLDLTSRALACAVEEKAAKKQRKASQKLLSAQQDADRLRPLIKAGPISERNDRVRAYQAAEAKVTKQTLAVRRWATRGNVSRYRATNAGQQ